MISQCDPLSPGFFTIAHLLLHLWAANISLNGCLERTDTLLYNVEERTIWWQFLEFCILPGINRAVGRCTVIYKYDAFIRIEIQPFLSQDVTEPMCIHTSRMEYEAIGRINGKCHGDITSSMPSYLSVCLVSDSGSSLVFGSPYIVTAFADENKVVHHSMPDKPTSVVRIVYGSHLAGFSRLVKVHDTVLLLISGLFGRRWGNSWLIFDSVRMQIFIDNVI